MYENILFSAIALISLPVWFYLLCCIYGYKVYVISKKNLSEVHIKIFCYIQKHVKSIKLMQSMHRTRWMDLFPCKIYAIVLYKKKSRFSNKERCQTETFGVLPFFVKDLNSCKNDKLSSFLSISEIARFLRQHHFT